MPSRNHLISGFHCKNTGYQQSLTLKQLLSFHWMVIEAISLSDFLEKSLKRPAFHQYNIICLRWSRVILVCWVLATLPAIPLMFNTTVESNWAGKSNCKCFLPIDDVSIWGSFLPFYQEVCIFGPRYYPPFSLSTGQIFFVSIFWKFPKIDMIDM